MAQKELLQAKIRLAVTAEKFHKHGPEGPEWQARAKRKMDQKPRPYGLRDLPGDTYTQSAGQIAQILKTHCSDFAQALHRLVYYVNSSGDNLTNQDLNRLEQAKLALYRAYGKKPPKGD